MQGNIGITTENIFPVIKKFLYSDHEIFLREIVSNAVDATQKLRALSTRGEVEGELGDLTVRVKIDKEAGTLTITDQGIGMTADEVDRYINQIAFSGANDFLEKYKDDAAAIIGHFGLGFYSSFMVASRVDIITRSYKPEAEAVKWTCDGSPAFELDTTQERTERGTDIVLHIDDDHKDFLEEQKIEELLRKYCRFLPVPVAFGKKKEWKDGKQQETQEDNQINDTTPLWTKTPSTLEEKDYKEFYRTLYPMDDEPLFWIHLNVDYPFHLTGVLYFPRIKQNIDIHRNKIQLYCNQVFVTDQVENIVPDFLTLLHGVIDSPDIPLNVSRSYLQSDANVKKISTYITKKVSDRLAQLFKDDREGYEQKWNDLKLFIHYGLLSQPDFYDKAKAYALLQDTEGKYFTYQEYQDAVRATQTDKNQNLVLLYATDREAQYAYIAQARAMGYSVLMLDGQLDVHLVGLLEQKLEKTQIKRVDADIPSRLIEKDEPAKNNLTDAERQTADTAFTSLLPKLEKSELHVEVANLGEEASPIVITQSEYMRRMKEMSRLQAGMSFYGEMPDMYSVVVNADHRLVAGCLEAIGSETKEALTPIEGELRGLEARRQAIEQTQEGRKPEEITQEERDDLKKVNDDIASQQQQRTALIADAARRQPVISQLIDLALLQNGMLRGEALTNFVSRSISLMK